MIKNTIEIELEDAKVLKTSFEITSFLIEETYIVFDPSGIMINAIDSSHVGMLGLSFPKEFFTSYKCSGKSRHGITVADVVKILRRCKTDDKLTLIKKEDDPNTLCFRFTSARSTRNFKLKSKEIQEYDEKEETIFGTFLETLDEKWTSTLHLDGGVLDEILKDASIISDLIRVQVSKELIDFLARDESGEVEVELDPQGDGILDSEIKDDAEGLYSINFLEQAIKIKDVVDSVELRLGPNVPILIRGNIDNDKGAVYNFILAPRVEDDDDDDIDAEDFDDDEFDDIGEDADLRDDEDPDIGLQDEAEDAGLDNEQAPDIS